MLSKFEVQQIQTKLNERLVSKLKVDGDFGPKTKKALFAALSISSPAHSSTKVELNPSPNYKMPAGEWFGAPWVGANINLLWLHEDDEALNAHYVPEWKLEGLNYTTLAGNDHAWCSVRENADKRKVGVKGTDSAAASSWSTWGRKCPYWFGATLDIRHPSGRRHVGDFLYWIDETNMIAAVLGGNQGNRFSIVSTKLSEGHARVVSGPRWSNDWPDGRLVSMTDVLKAYPYLKAKGSMGPTT